MKALVTFLICLGALVIPQTLKAQKQLEIKVERITQRMSKKLNLTSEQKGKVYQVNLKRAKGHKDAYNHGRKKETIKTAVRIWEEELRAILTPEQQAKLNL